VSATEAGATDRPTPRQVLLLRAALLRGDAARDAWRRARALVGPAHLDALCEPLLPLVYRNVAPLGNDAGLEALKARYVRTWSDNLAIVHAVRPLLRALEQNGIDAVALKGLALIARFYEDLGVRPMADVDLLVTPADLDRTAAIAADLGWRPRYQLTPGFRRVKHASPFDHATDAPCDLHWRVFEEAGDDAADEDLRAQAEPVDFHGARFRVLSPADQLLHVCGHAARWSEVPVIRWVPDAVTVIRAGRIDWQRLVDQTSRRRFVLRMRRMLAYLRSSLDVPIPASVEAALAHAPVSLLERLEDRVRTREQRLLGELPTYLFNCFRGERRPVLALPGYLRDAWGLPSLGTVPRHALGLASERLRMALGCPRKRP
jgi:hypothetical protein